MAHSQIVCGYQVTAQGAQPIATLAAALSVVPIDQATLLLHGLLPIRDQIATVGQTATRTITLQMAPALPAVATCKLFTDAPGGAIQSLLLVNPEGNGDYALAPIITFVGGTPVRHKARAVANMVMIDPIVLKPGSGYTSAATATAVGGGLVPGGRPAAVAPVIIGGAVGGISVTDVGSGYTSFPQIVISDVPGGGSGAVVFGGLTVASLTLFDPGVYATAPSLVFTPAFQATTPDTANQATAVRGFMTRAMEEALRSQVVALTPIVT
jgi:hypothetical protein